MTNAENVQGELTRVANDRRLSFKERIAFSAIAIFGLPGTGFLAVQPDLPADVIHTVAGHTDKEKAISHAVKDSMGVTM
jgi:hypothetical protein